MRVEGGVEVERISCKCQSGSAVPSSYLTFYPSVSSAFLLCSGLTGAAGGGIRFGEMS